MDKKYAISAIAIVAVLMTAYNLSGISESLVLNNTSSQKLDVIKQDTLELPDFARKTVRVEEAYIFAAQNQEIVMYISCYCGCANMQHSDKLIEHSSLKECYIRQDGSFEPHASSCKACNDITLRVKELITQGYSIGEAREIIDDMYSGRVGTNTPLPP